MQSYPFPSQSQQLPEEITGESQWETQEGSPELSQDSDSSSEYSYHYDHDNGMGESQWELPLPLAVSTAACRGDNAALPDLPPTSRRGYFGTNPHGTGMQSIP